MMSKDVLVSKKKCNKFSRSILYVASECQPFYATGGLADVMGSLPNALKSKYPDSDIRVALPLYKNVNLDRSKLTFIGHFYVNLSWRKEYCGVFEYVCNDIVYYFIDNERYFKRDNYYGYGDDAERYAFFSKGVLDLLKMINFFPEIIHVNEWQSALIPVYLKTHTWEDVRYSHIKTVLTIHNIIYQGRYNKGIIGDVLGIDSRYTDLLTHHGDVNFIKAAMVCADRVVTVSQSYSKEIQTIEGGMGLDDVARSISYKLTGIVNGLDYDFYNPSLDKIIWENYDCNNLTNKAPFK